MIDTPETPTPSTELLKRLVVATERASTQRTPAADWTYADSSEAGPSPVPEAKLDDDTLSAALDLTGNLQGTLYFAVSAAKVGDLAFAAAGGGTVSDPQAAWLAWLQAVGQELATAGAGQSGFLAVGTPRQAVLPANTVPLGRLQRGGAERSAQVGISVRIDLPLVTSMARLLAAQNAEAAHAELDERQRLERVVHVPLAVTLRFGQRRISLRELLALTTGSLLELDRQVEEPVELVLGDRVVARGEVVVVDGNYGLRVLELVEGAASRVSSRELAAVAVS